VIVLDEPTTGLDVTTQAHILETVRELCGAHGVAALYVTHDLAVIANLVHRVLVTYAGRVAEVGPRDRVFERPAHPYTSLLLRAVPDVEERRALVAIHGQAPAPGQRPQGCFFAPRCPLAIDICTKEDPPILSVEDDHHSCCHRAAEVIGKAAEVVGKNAHVAPSEARSRSAGTEPVLTVRNLDAFFGRRKVLDQISLELGRRECLALVGESGSGKTTLARSIIGLTARHTGEIRFNGELLRSKARERPLAIRRVLQYIFQSPYNALNPRQTIGDIVEAPVRHFFGAKGVAAQERVTYALGRVALSPRVAARFPYELSGGERQRVAIARALVCQPEVLICDEITSALDVSVQATIVELLAQLQKEEDLAMLFVTHNLALVRAIADRICVLRQGQVVETGQADEILVAPMAEYTRELLADTPKLAFASRARLTESARAADPRDLRTLVHPPADGGE
jgi:peptide/nickel transport system ATP-binding protein